MANALQETSWRANGESADDLDIQVRAVGRGPLTRLAGAIGRAVTAVGEALYDYSGGEYGLHPVEAAEVRHERKRPKPVAVVEVREQSETRWSRAWLPIAGGILGVAVGVTVVAIWQRRRLQTAARQAVEMGRRAKQQAQALTGQVMGAREASHAERTPTPDADQVARGELLAPSGVGGAALMNGTSAAGHAPGQGASDTEATSG